ncbi:hypothetical protein N7468_001295 [Penicillium chermesinum]|uniref:NB-ARC domain-containing protein n=1 Tax=Penicillium chermesinum TaxID=63820 RepID=A0A9W9PJA7_9EURO|nr:uncharacterized protein N7468_001295 [Penicillium chermesinum]KAJ5246312.1 hypothetical protein N7468_001295 [Penicillium chermesinum]
MPHYIIPSLRSEHFTGRESVLEELQQKLCSQPQTQKIALFGLGGIGKTQVALELARWVKSQVPDCSIFWAPALSLESFEQACWQIAKAFQIHQNSDNESVMESVQRLLGSDKAGKWLFIVDNVDDLDLLFDELYQYFPSSEKGITLLTTRSREVAVSFAKKDIVELRKMTIEEGIAFLSKIVQAESLRDQESTTKLLEELDLLPLAIAQAAYYISRNNATTTRYLELMHKTEMDRMRLVSRDFRDSTRYRKMPNAVTATWLVSFNQIKNSDPSAASLLEFMSFLEPKAIPQSILPILTSEEEMEFAVGTLCSYGFLARRDQPGIFDMHSLVQLSTRIWIAEAKKTPQTIATITQRMNRCFPSDEHTERKIWRRYMPHALQVLRREENKDMSERYSLLTKVGNCILADGRAKEAINSFHEVYIRNQSLFDEEHPSRLASQRNLARAYEFNGQFKQAVELFEHITTVHKRTLDEEHPSRLASQHELARVYRSNGQIKQAVALVKHEAAVLRRTLDEEHPSILASQHELARIYRSNRQNQEAVKLLEHVVAVEERTLDEEDPSRLVSQHELAVAYRSTRQLKQAIELLEHVVMVYSRIFDEEHPFRLVSQYELARTYRLNGQAEQAIQLFEHVVEVRQGALDEEHPDRLASQRMLQNLKLFTQFESI